MVLVMKDYGKASGSPMIFWGIYDELSTTEVPLDMNYTACAIFYDGEGVFVAQHRLLGPSRSGDAGQIVPATEVIKEYPEQDVFMAPFSKYSFIAEIIGIRLPYAQGEYRHQVLLNGLVAAEYPFVLRTQTVK